MELGSLVCTPTEPKCDDARWPDVCAAYAAGLQHEIPRAKPRQQFHRPCAKRPSSSAKRPRAHAAMRRAANAGPACGIFRDSSWRPKGRCLPSEEIVAKVREQTGITCAPGPLLKTIKHGVTRYRITLDCYQAEYIYRPGSCTRTLDQDSRIGRFTAEHDRPQNRAVSSARKEFTIESTEIIKKNRKHS